MPFQHTSRVEQKQATKRTAILQAAKEVFSQDGFGRATIKDIARKAGIATGTFYLYFGSKETVFQALVDSIYEMILESISEERQHAAGTLQKLEVSIKAVVRLFAEHRFLARIVLIQMAGSKPAFSQQLFNLQEALAAFVQEDLEEAAEQGLIPCQDYRVSALAFVGTFYQVLLAWLREENPFPLEAALANLTSYNMRAIGANPAG
ncbi:MAG: TetR/AcrR family transcriptional regulator [Bacillota bacterium]